MGIRIGVGTCKEHEARKGSRKREGRALVPTTSVNLTQLETSSFELRSMSR